MLRGALKRENLSFLSPLKKQNAEFAETIKREFCETIKKGVV